MYKAASDDTDDSDEDMEYDDNTLTTPPPAPALQLSKQRYDSGESGIFSVTDQCTCSSGSHGSNLSCQHCSTSSTPSSPLQSRLQDTASRLPSLVTDQPLDMSKKAAVQAATTVNSCSIKPQAVAPLSHREQFKSLYLLVDAAVGLLEKEESLRRYQATSCA